MGDEYCTHLSPLDPNLVSFYLRPSFYDVRYFVRLSQFLAIFIHKFPSFADGTKTRLFTSEGWAPSEKIMRKQAKLKQRMDDYDV